MKRRQWYRLHKWIAVGSGLALLAWCVSGLAMLLPHIAPSISELPNPQEVGPQADYATVTVSPAQAAQALASGGATSPVYTAFLRRIGDRVAYEMRMEDETRGLVDARTGEPFVIDSAMAVSLARFETGSTAEVIGFARIESPNANYPYGDLPAFTVEFADAPGIALTAAIGTGEVMRSGTVSRTRLFIENVHTFRQLNRFLPGVVTYWILVIFTILTTIAAVIGFWIALPKTWLPVVLGGASRRGPTPDSDANYQGDR